MQPSLFQRFRRWLNHALFDCEYEQYTRYYWDYDTYLCETITSCNYCSRVDMVYSFPCEFWEAPEENHIPHFRFQPRDW